MRQLLRARRATKAQLEDVIDQRAELMMVPKVARYVQLHAAEQMARDELTKLEVRIADLAELQEEVP